jgi:tetratricopeptide (TPR) repeat protein
MGKKETKSMEVNKMMFGKVQDLTPRLCELSAVAIEAILEIARILIYQARMEDAVELLSSDNLRIMAETAEPGTDIRILLAKAEAMVYQAIFANAGHDAALEVLAEAEEKAKSLGDKKLIADVFYLTGWGTKFREMTANRIYAAAVVPYAERSLELCEEIGDERGIAKSSFLLGLCHEYGREATHDEAHEGIVEAEKLYRRALEIAEKIQDKELLINITRDLGWLCRRKGEAEQAFNLLKHSLELMEETGFKALLAPGYHTMAVMYLERDEPDKALAYGRKALRMATENGFTRQRVASLFPIGGALLMKGRREEALRSYQEGLELAQEMNHKLAIAEFERQIAEIEADV